MPIAHKAAPVVLAAAAVLFATTAGAAPAGRFMTKALQGDNSEIRLGRLAQDRGVSPGVRDFGRMLAEDHRTARDQALEVARLEGVRPTDGMAPEARAEERRLQRLSGPAFDREFVRYMVEDHRKDVDDFRRQARTGDRATRRLAQQTLPTLEHHLQVARSLQRGR